MTPECQSRYDMLCFGGCGELVALLAAKPFHFYNPASTEASGEDEIKMDVKGLTW